jgi:hypothetical protein
MENFKGERRFESKEFRNPCPIGNFCGEKPKCDMFKHTVFQESIYSQMLHLNHDYVQCGLSVLH